MRDGGGLPDGQVKDTVELDEIFQALDPRTRASFQGWQQQLSRAIDGHSQDLNDALGTLPAFANDGTDLLRVLDGQKQQTQDLIRNTGVLFGALTADERKLHDLIVTAGQTFDATSRRQDALAETFRIFPTFLDESKLTFARVETFSKDTDPLVRDLRPALRDAVPTLRRPRARAGPAQDVHGPGAADQRVADGPAGDDADARRRVADARRAAAVPRGAQPGAAVPRVPPARHGGLISNGAATLADTVPTTTPNQVGHYLRQLGPVGPETVGMYANRPPASRGNAYLNPGALSGQKRAQAMMFPNFDCNNAGGEHQTATPDTADIPSCFVQDPPAWPPGNKLRYPHIDRADYSSK